MRAACPIRCRMSRSAAGCGGRNIEFRAQNPCDRKSIHNDHRDLSACRIDSWVSVAGVPRSSIDQGNLDALHCRDSVNPPKHQDTPRDPTTKRTAK